MVLTVKQCCCGCTLKTGTIIIGVLYGLGAIGTLINSIMKAGAPLLTPEDARQLNITEKVREQLNSATQAGTYTNIVLAIILVIQIVLCIMLIYGASNENPRLVKPWIIYSIISLVLTSIIYFIVMIIAFVYISVLAGVIVLVGTVIGIALGAYFIIVVNSFHRELLGERNPSKI